jgi:hypothetical protein
MEMPDDIHRAVIKVMKIAPDYPHYWDLSDAERLLVLIALGFEEGRQYVRKPSDSERN